MMARIPSTERTDDFIYRFEIKTGTPLPDPDDPHLLVIEGFVGPAGLFHSMDLTISRDGQRANDIEFRSFEHFREPNMTHVKFMFRDKTYHVIRHAYMLTIILRYLV